MSYKFLFGLIVFSLSLGRILWAGELTEQYNLSLIESRKTMINQLISDFHKSDSQEYKRSAIYTLGELRATEAGPLLIENIDFGWEDDRVYKAIPKYPMPAVVALCKIGVSSTPLLLKGIKSSVGEDKIASRKMTFLSGVLLEIYGSDLVMVLLETETKKSVAQTERENLQKAITIISQWHGQRKATGE